MADNFAYIGSRTVGSCIPSVIGLQAGLLAELQPKLAGALNVAAALTIGPPALAVTVQGAIAAAAALQASVTGPTITLQAAAVLDLIVMLKAQIAILVRLGLLFGTAGVSVYAYEGRNDHFATAAGAALPHGFPGTPSEPANALVLATVSPVAWSAMKEIFGL